MQYYYYILIGTVGSGCVFGCIAAGVLAVVGPHAFREDRPGL